MTLLPKSQWSWDLSKKKSKGEVQMLIIAYKKGKILLRWEDNKHWVLPGCLTIWPPEDVELAREALNVKWCVWPVKIAWSSEVEHVKVLPGSKTHMTLQKSVVVLECCEEDPPAPSGYEWRPLEGAQVYHLFPDAATRIAEQISIAIRGVYPEKTVVWQRPGWLLSAVSYLETVVGSKVVKPVHEVHRASCRGAVFKACTSIGDFYFKCSGPMANDASHTAAMAMITPAHCPRPLYVDRKKRIMITRDYGKSMSVVSKTEIEVVKECLGMLASIQQSTIGKIDELIEAGFLDARDEVFSARFDEIVGHRMLDFVEGFDGTGLEEFPLLLKRVQLFRKYSAEIKEKLDKEFAAVADLNIPATVVHHDLNKNNFMRHKESGNLIAIDWEFGCVGHPFMDRSLIDFSTDERRAYYFSKWAEYGAEGMGNLPFVLRGFAVELLMMLNLFAGVQESARVLLFKVLSERLNFFVDHWE